MHISPLQQINFINPDRLFIPIEGDNNAKANSSLRRRDYNYKNREYLSGNCINVAGLLQITRESNEVQVRRVEYQLDRHKDDDDVTTCQDTCYADDEQQGAYDEKLREIRMLYFFPGGTYSSRGRGLLENKRERGKEKANYLVINHQLSVETLIAASGVTIVAKSSGATSSAEASCFNVRASITEPIIATSRSTLAISKGSEA